MTHPIPVRNMLFDPIPVDEFEPVCVANNPVLSYSMLGVSLYVAWLEPFIVKSMRKVISDITDPELKENVERFSRQEAQHYQNHQRFNETLLDQQYPGLQQRYDELRLDFDRMLDEQGSRYCIGFVEGFEALTTQGALRILESGALRHSATDKRIGDLFSWHLMEEIEHRNVAFDIYEHLYGDYAYRARMCIVAQTHIFRFLDDCTSIMSRHDRERYGDRCHVTWLQKKLFRLGQWVATVRSCLPSYSPHHYIIPDGLQALSDHYSNQATRVS